MLTKESITVKKRSLDRHNKIIAELNVIARNDEGRISEYVQAEARKILVEQDINHYEKELMTTLSTLSKYTGFPVGESDLVNPFEGMTVSDMYREFTAENNNKNPAYLVSQADIDAKKMGVKVEGEILPLVPKGVFDLPLAPLELKARLEKALQRNVLHCGDNAPEAIRSIAWCTGGGQGFIQD
ncbi:hypothetical protein ABN128_31750, partial [Klebsiella variicola subsp. variicola]